MRLKACGILSFVAVVVVVLPLLRARLHISSPETIMIVPQRDLLENFRLMKPVSSVMSSTPAAGVTLAPDILSNVYISVKTTPKYYDSRLRILKKTWFQKVDKEKFTIVSDHVNESFVNCKLFEEELIKEGFHLVTTKCLIKHHREGLCCKSGVEYGQFYDYFKRHKTDVQQVQWYCHFDDDIYVNVKELSNLLTKYDPTKPYYIGRYPRTIGVTS
ncbi:fringe glycosyltransferase-like [Dysidea avara]|uniref:fringe glycosyltransferase-like n=1 Tax=Dysidea avara TaxID=196820 RepID=UPI00331D72DC